MIDALLLIIVYIDSNLFICSHFIIKDERAFNYSIYDGVHLCYMQAFQEGAVTRYFYPPPDL
jgi:hypothetical protein